MNMKLLPIVKGILEGERLSLARAISIIDNDESASRLIISQVFRKTGNAKTVGFTGAGGAGASSSTGVRVSTSSSSSGVVAPLVSADSSSSSNTGLIIGVVVGVAAAVTSKV